MLLELRNIHCLSRYDQYNDTPQTVLLISQTIIFAMGSPASRPHYKPGTKQKYLTRFNSASELSYSR